VAVMVVNLTEARRPEDRAPTEGASAARYRSNGNGEILRCGASLDYA